MKTKPFIALLLLSVNITFAIDLSDSIIATKDDCRNYTSQYTRFTTAFNNMPEKAAKYHWNLTKMRKSSIHMIKSTQDDLLKYCGKYIDLVPYKKQKKLVDDTYQNYWGNTK